MPGPPDFSKPPVHEVALGAYFDPIPSLGLVGIGELRRRWGERYPKLQEQPPAPPVFPESFGMMQIGVPTITFGPSAPTRVWFLSEDEQQLVQVQRDRLVHNWRRLLKDAEYPHYHTLRPQFERDAEDLHEFLASEGIEARFVQAEVSYINQISIGQISPAARIAQLIAPWSGQMSDGFLPDPEETQISLRFVITRPHDDAPAGRLYASVQPALRQNAGGQVESFIQLQLFARGAPLGDGIDGVLAFLDLGHDWLVRGFRSLTMPEAHKEWEIQGND